MDNLGLWVALILTFVITNSFSFFMLSLNRMKNRSKVSWQLIHKLETSFLLMDFSKKELEEKKTERDWFILIDLYRQQYAFFEKYLFDEGYKNRKVSAKWKNYIVKDLRGYLIKWEKYDLKSNEVIKGEQPEDFFDDFKRIKSISKKFYYKISKKAKAAKIVKERKAKKEALNNQKKTK